MALSHVSLNVTDLKKSEDWYMTCLKPLGAKLFMRIPYKDPNPTLGLGICSDGGFNPDLWLTQIGHPCAAPNIKGSTCHVAFWAPTRRQVDEFYEAAMKAGGKDNGKPGIRPYMPTYYAAYVFDPDGNNVEAFCLKPGFYNWIVERKAIFLSAVAAAAAGAGLKFFEYF